MTMYINLNMNLNMSILVRDNYFNNIVKRIIQPKL